MTQNMKRLQTLIDQVLKDMGFLTLNDVAAWSRIQTRLERVAENLEPSRPGAAQWAQVLASVVEKLLLNNDGNESPNLASLQQGLVLLQKQMSLEGDDAAFKDQSDKIYQSMYSESQAASVDDEADSEEEMIFDSSTVDGEEESVLVDDEADSEEEMISNSPTVDDEEERDLEGFFTSVDANSKEVGREEFGEATSVMDADFDDELDLEMVDSDVTEAQPVATPSVLQERIDQLAVEVMAVDLDDLTGLGKMHTQLDDLVAFLDSGQTLLKELTSALSLVVEKIILDDCGEMDDPLDGLTRGITLLQRLQLSFEHTGKETLDDPDLFREIVLMADGSMGHEPSAMDEEDLEAEMAASGSLAASNGVAKAPPAPTTYVAPEVDKGILAEFIAEAEAHIETAESVLLSLESNVEDAELLNTVFRSYHTIKGGAGFLNLQEVTQVAHIVEDLLDSARKGKVKLNPLMLDAIFESVDLLKGLLENVQKSLEGETVEGKDLAPFFAKMNAVQGQPVVSVTNPTAGTVSEAPVAKKEVVGTGGDAPREGGEGPARSQNYVRVGTEKLDHLVNLVGELVISQTQVSQNGDILNSTNQKLTKDISQLMKISNDLQEIAMSMRMVPIRGTFERMARMVRDLGRKCGKQVTFQMSGEDTELDKNVVEEIVDPLTHMVRNAVDHGLEDPEQRQAVGKNESGLVSLRAYHKGGNIIIELRDDGKGLDHKKILKKAIERGVIGPNEELTEEAAYNLIFEPGFSTAEVVTDLSGRGVGMDVVRRSIEKLRGKVDVSSEPGKGSVFTIHLPLTLAIIDGMVVGVGSERYILPMTSIVRSLRPEKKDLHSVLEKGEMIKVQKELYPLIRLHDWFQVVPRSQDPSDGLVVVVEREGGRCGILVDELVGMQQVVIKGLHKDLRNDACLAGCAILGDGLVGLILDANGFHTNNKNGKSGRDIVYTKAS